LAFSVYSRFIHTQQVSFTQYLPLLFILDKPQNYFEKLDLTNSWPNPISVKKRYQEKMNDINQEMLVASKS